MLFTSIDAVFSGIWALHFRCKIDLRMHEVKQNCWRIDPTGVMLKSVDVTLDTHASAFYHESIMNTHKVIRGRSRGE